MHFLNVISEIENTPTIPLPSLLIVLHRSDFVSGHVAGQLLEGDVYQIPSASRIKSGRNDDGCKCINKLIFSDTIKEWFSLHAPSRVSCVFGRAGHSQLGW